MCFRDRQYCKDKSCAKFNTCDRAFTVRVEIAADKWWVRGGGKPGEAPVDLNVERPECFEK